MVRTNLIASLTLAGVLTASPAVAQFPNIFDSIFGNPQQRPPADVPNRPPASVPSGPQYIPPPGGLPPGPPPGGRIQTQPLPPPPGATSAPPPNDEVVVEPSANKITNPTAVFSGLDKITGRIISFDVAINETVRFGALEVTPRACYSRPPTEAANTDGFIEVDELTLQGELRRVFTGWMFAASPGLSAVEHPIYDIWLMDCKGGAPPAVAETAPATATPPRPAPQRTQPQRRSTQQLPPPPLR